MPRPRNVPKTRLHQHLRSWRGGRTQFAVAEELGWSESTLSELENTAGARRSRSPTLDELAALARIYHARHPADLLFDPEEARHRNAVLADHAEFYMTLTLRQRRALIRLASHVRKPRD